MPLKVYKYGHEPKHKVPDVQTCVLDISVGYVDAPRKQRVFDFSLWHVWVFDFDNDMWLPSKGPLTLPEANELVRAYRQAGATAMRVADGQRPVPARIDTE